MIKNNKIIRFGIVGTINTALDFGLLFLFTHLGLPKIASNTLSTGMAFIFSFLTSYILLLRWLYSYLKIGCVL